MNTQQLFLVTTTLGALIVVQAAAPSKRMTKWDYSVVSTPDFNGPFRGNDATFHAPVSVDVAKPNLGGAEGAIGKFEIIVDSEGKTTVEHSLIAASASTERRMKSVLLGWRSQPATLDGKPIRVRLRVSISNETR